MTSLKFYLLMLNCLHNFFMLVKDTPNLEDASSSFKSKNLAKSSYEMSAVFWTLSFFLYTNWEWIGTSNGCKMLLGFARKFMCRWYLFQLDGFIFQKTRTCPIRYTSFSFTIIFYPLLRDSKNIVILSIGLWSFLWI